MTYMINYLSQALFGRSLLITFNGEGGLINETCNDRLRTGGWKNR